MTMVATRSAGMLGFMATRVSSPVVVGRDAEIQSIEAALDRAAAGETVHLLLAGEAGVGKTRLTSEAARLAGDRGFLVLRGDCGNVGGSSLPYGPFVEALRDLAAELGPDGTAEMAGPAADDLARLVPAFGSLEAAPAPSEWVQARLFEALFGLFGRLGERSPVLLIVEDLHWADTATRQTIAYLVRSLRDVRFAFIGTFRSDELHRRHALLPWLAELDRGGRVERIDVARLDRGQVATLLTAILGAQPAAQLVDDVFSRSDGNPFFAEELLAASRQGTANPRLPPTLREILLAHIAGVPEHATAVLRVSAVAGRRVEHELLALVADLPEDDLLEGLRAAVAGHLLVVETGDGDERYAFRHALVQEAVYEELLPGERRTLHRAFAEALDARTASGGAAEAGRWAELAHHWAAARQDDRAFDASLRAANAAMESYAFGAALVAYELALELWDDVDDPAAVAGFDRTELYRKAGLAAYLMADYRRAAALRREASRLIDPDVDPLRAGILREELGRGLWVLGDSSGALAAYREAAAITPADRPTAERARALSGLGQVLMLVDRYEESRALCQEAIAIARQVKARAQEGHALNSYGRDLTLLGACADGIDAVTEALEIARETRVADDVGRAYVNLVESYFDCGNTAEAIDIASAGIRECDELGIGSSYGHYIRLNGTTCAYVLGRWGLARTWAEEALARMPTGWGAELYRSANILQLYVGEGSFEAADPWLERAFELLAPGSGAQFIGPIHAAAAERDLWRRRPLEALQASERALAWMAETDDAIQSMRLCRLGAWAAADLADAARATRDSATIEDARARLDRIADRLAEFEPRYAGMETARELVAHRMSVDAERSRVDGRPDPAAWRAVAEAWAAFERPYFAAYAGWRESEAALAGGDRAAATSALRAAYVAAAALGARPLHEALDALARRARIALEAPTEVGPAARPVEDDPFGLTPREREVLALVADGRTNRQIAERLFISESTAGVHVSNILGKLGVASRGEAAAIAFRLGLVTDGVETASTA
jgi:DNA-binding CsgD family transcriptional regulator/tetratricopeptide (TPR) repeat protein